MTYRELIEKTGEKLEKNGFEQIPQLEGGKRPIDDLFLAPIV